TDRRWWGLNRLGLGGRLLPGDRVRLHRDPLLPTTPTPTPFAAGACLTLAGLTIARTGFALRVRLAAGVLELLVVGRLVAGLGGQGFGQRVLFRRVQLVAAGRRLLGGRRGLRRGRGGLLQPELPSEFVPVVVVCGGVGH